VTGELLRSQSFVVASGGLSFPKLGATDFGYRIAEQFALRIVPRARVSFHLPSVQTISLLSRS
jgi:predicted flavoprotein YhiN